MHSGSGADPDVAGRGGALECSHFVLIRSLRKSLFCLLGQGAGMAGARRATALQGGTLYIYIYKAIILLA
jgi:hypothetical protein